MFAAAGLALFGRSVAFFFFQEPKRPLPASGDPAVATAASPSRSPLSDNVGSPTDDGSKVTSASPGPEDDGATGLISTTDTVTGPAPSGVDKYASDGYNCYMANSTAVGRFLLPDVCFQLSYLFPRVVCF